MCEINSKIFLLSDILFGGGGGGGGVVIVDLDKYIFAWQVGFFWGGSLS